VQIDDDEDIANMIDHHPRGCSGSRDLFKFWEMSYNILVGLTVQD